MKRFAAFFVICLAALAIYRFFYRPGSAPALLVSDAESLLASPMAAVGFPPPIVSPALSLFPPPAAELLPQQLRFGAPLPAGGAIRSSLSRGAAGNAAQSGETDGPVVETIVLPSPRQLITVGAGERSFNVFSLARTASSDIMAMGVTCGGRRFYDGEFVDQLLVRPEETQEECLAEYRLNDGTVVRNAFLVR